MAPAERVSPSRWIDLPWSWHGGGQLGAVVVIFRMVKRTHTCVDCGARVPPQDDDSALISVKYGWRLTRNVDEKGEPRLEWRCPTCWTKYRETRKSPDARGGNDT